MRETKIELITGDCINEMGKMAPESVDVCVTSPPYNLGIKYRNYNDNIQHDSYMAWTNNWLMAAKRVLKPNGSLFLNLGGCPRRPMLPHEVVVMCAAHLILQNTFTWVKSLTIERPGHNALSVGHFKPINSKRFVNDCQEYIFHFTKTGNVEIDRLALGVGYADQSNVKRWAHSGGKNKRCRGNVWYIPYTTIVSRTKNRPHPSTFPPKLAENCMLLHGDLANQVVLDPFIGIGNTAIGGMNVGVNRVIGFDIDHSYLVDADHFVKQRKQFLEILDPTRHYAISDLSVQTVREGESETTEAQPESDPR